MKGSLSPVCSGLGESFCYPRGRGGPGEGRFSILAPGENSMHLHSHSVERPGEDFSTDTCAGFKVDRAGPCPQAIDNLVRAPCVLIIKSGQEKMRVAEKYQPFVIHSARIQHGVAEPSR